MKKIYLDYAATTPLAFEVYKAMKPYLSEKFGNPSSLHFFGQEALKAVDHSRLTIAKFLNCETQEIVFTSGATESNNFALKGVIEKIINERNFEKLSRVEKPHIITSMIEHHCILETAKYLEKRGVEVSYLPVNHEGILNIKSVQLALKNNTVLVSIMYANNEIGTIQPIMEIGKIIEKENKKREKQKKPKIIFHTDAVQAIEYLDCNVKKLKVDLLSFSGHKIYGPKGIGVLYVKKGTPITQILHGGAQEYKLRAGTLNVPGIVGIGKAIELIQKKEHRDEIKRIKKLRDKLIKNLITKIPQIKLNGSLKFRLPNNANFTFRNVEGESVLLHLDFEGIAVSTGSACASGSLEPSHVLLALGLSHEDAHGSVRFTLGRKTTEKDIDYVIKVLPMIIKKLRKISPIK